MRGEGLHNYVGETGGERGIVFHGTVMGLSYLAECYIHVCTAYYY